MNLGDKKQANIYVPKNIHDFFVNVAKHTPFSVGDLYVMSAIKILGRIPEFDQEAEYQSLGMELFQKLNSGSSNLETNQTLSFPILANPKSSKSQKESDDQSNDSNKQPSLSSEITARKKTGTKPVKTHRDDPQYLWMLQNEMEVWKPCFDRFTHLAQITAIQSPTDEDMNLIVDQQENLYVITFMGYSNPKKGSYGVYDREPLLSTNVGFFITTLLCGDAEGLQVYAGRSVPRKLFNILSDADLEKNAASAPEIMFTKPDNLSELETPFWGYCNGSLSFLERLFENNVDYDYLDNQLDCEESLEGKSFLEVLALIFKNHYGNWQYFFDNYEIKVAAEKYNHQGSEE